MDGSFTNDEDVAASNEEVESSEEEMEQEEEEAAPVTKKMNPKIKKKLSPKDKTAAKTSELLFGQMIPNLRNKIITAVGNSKDRKGASLAAIKSYLTITYSMAPNKVKGVVFKNTFTKCLEDEILVRTAGTAEASGLTGRFRLSQEWLKTQKKEQREKANKAKLLQKKREKDEKKKDEKKTKKPPKDIDVKKLKSLKEKSASVKMAEKSLKKARKSVLNTPKPKSVPKKRTKTDAAVKTTNGKEKDTKKKSAATKTKKSSAPKKAPKKAAPKKAEPAQKKGGTKGKAKAK